LSRRGPAEVEAKDSVARREWHDAFHGVKGGLMLQWTFISEMGWQDFTSCSEHAQFTCKCPHVLIGLMANKNG
jgi:hypothetical protein